MKIDSVILQKTILLLLNKEKNKLPWQQSNAKLIAYLCKVLIDLNNVGKKKRVRTKWVSEIYREERRLLQGASDNLLVEMRESDQAAYYNFLRMSPEVFDQLLDLVGPYISKQDAVRASIPAKVRLQLTVRYCATGDNINSISYAFRVSPSSVCNIIAETCKVIWDQLKRIVFPEITEQLWTEISKEFDMRWQFPHCCGAVDGKLVKFKAPEQSGSEFYDYKGHHSIHFMGYADANCKFTMVDVGAAGRQSDGGVFNASVITQSLKNGELLLPPAQPLVPGGVSLPYVFIGDEAFALSTFMLRPYPRSSNLTLRKKVYNYRLSRARRIVEAAFGLLSGVWRVLITTMQTSVAVTVKVTKACICLHNFLLEFDEESKRNAQTRLAQMDIADLGAEVYPVIHRVGVSSGIHGANVVREHFTDFFMEEGAVCFQWEKAVRADF